MNALDVQNIVTGILTKVASQKAEEKKPAKEEKKEVVKGMDSCKYAFSLADSLTEAVESFDYNFGSALDKATKVAYDSPNTLERSKATGVDFKSKNEHLDAMAVGEDPAKPSSPSVSEPTVQHLKTTVNTVPGGKKESPSSPPLYNKTASTYEKILNKLASKSSLESPNSLERLEVTDSGKGQQGFDSGKSDGNNLRHLIETSNEKAMDYTQRDAKRDYIKEQMGQVFDNVHPERDTVVERFVDRGKETSKLANLEDAKKMKEMATKEVEEEKKEEKVVPGIHKKIEKEAFSGSDIASLAGAGGGQYLENKLRGKSSEKSAPQEEKQAEEKCTCEGKGTCDCCKAKMVKKLATILVAMNPEKTAGMESALGDGSAVSGGGMDTPGMTPPQSPDMGGQSMGQATPEEIERLKKILLMLQMKRQQEEAAMSQAQQGASAQSVATSPEMAQNTPQMGAQ